MINPITTIVSIIINILMIILVGIVIYLNIKMQKLQSKIEENNKKTIKHYLEQKSEPMPTWKVLQDYEEVLNGEED